MNLQLPDPTGVDTNMKTTQSSVRRIFGAALLPVIGAVFLTTASLQAEPPPGAPEKGGDRKERMEKRLDEMKTSLSLTDEQVAKIQAIRDEQMAAFKALKDDASLTQDQRKEKSKELRAASETKINAVLTPEQAAKWEEQKKQRRDKKPN